MADEIKNVTKELGGIRTFLMNSAEAMYAEMQSQTSALLSIQDAMKNIKPSGSTSILGTDKEDKNDKSKQAAGGTINVKDFMADLKSIITVMPKFNKAMKDLKSKEVNNFNRFLKNMTKAITQDGKYGEPAQIQKLYKTVGNVFNDLGDSLTKFSKGLLVFGLVTKLKLDDLFIKFVDKFFAKDRMQKLDPEPAEKAGRALQALGKGIGIFSLMLALSTPLMIIGLPALVIGLPIIMGAFFLFSKFSKQAEEMKQTKDLLIGLSAGLLAVAVSMIMMRFVQPKDMLMTVGLLGVFALFMWITSKVSGGSKDGGPGAKAMIAFGIGLVALTGAMILMKYVEWESIFKAALIMGVLSLMFLVIGMMKGGAKDAAILMGTIALSMVALVLVMMAYEKVSWESIGKGMAVMGGLAMTVYFLGKSKQQSIAGLLIIAGMTLALWALSAIIPLYGAMSWEDIGKAGAVVAGLGLVLWLMGKRANDVLKGAASLLIATAAIFGLTYVVKKFGEIGVTWEMLGMLGTLVAGTGLAFALAGSQGALIAEGALAMGLSGVALMSITYAMKIFTGAKPTWEMLGMLGALVVGLGVAFAGGGVVSGLIVAGAGAMLVAGAALIVLAKGLQMISGVFNGLKNLLADSGHVTDSTFGFGGGRMMSNLEWMTYSLANAFLLSPVTIASMYASVPAFYLVGKTLKEVASGLMDVVKLNVPLNTIGTIISGILTAVSVPFAEIGKMQDVSGGWFGMGQNPVAKGLASVQGIGRVLADIAKGVQDFANLTFVDSNGKRVSIPAADLAPGGKISTSIASVISAVGSAFGDLGKNAGETSWWSDNYIQTGIKSIKGAGHSLAEIAKGVQAVANLTFTDANGKKTVMKIADLAEGGNVYNSIKAVISAVGFAFADIGKNSGETSWWSDNYIEIGVKSVKGAGAVIAEIAKGVQSIANLTFTDANGKVIPLGKDALGKDGTVSKNIKNAIASIGFVLGAIGSAPNTATDWWAGYKSIELGGIYLANTMKGINTIVNMAKSAADSVLKIPVDKFDAGMKSLIGSYNNILSSGKNNDQASMSSRAAIFGGVTANIVSLSNTKDKIAGVATSIEKISNSLGKVLGSLEKLPLDKMDKINQIFKNLVEVGKLDDGKIGGILEKAGNFVDRTGKALNVDNVKGGITVAAAAPVVQATGQSELVRLRNENNMMQQMMAQLLQTMQSIDSKLSKTLTVDIVDSDITALLARK